MVFIQLKLYPNPVTNVLHVATNNSNITTITLTDALEKLRLTQRVNTHQQTVDMNVQKLEAGLYYITVTGEGGRRVSAMVTKK